MLWSRRGGLELRRYFESQAVLEAEHSAFLLCRGLQPRMTRTRSNRAAAEAEDPRRAAAEAEDPRRAAAEAEDRSLPRQSDIRAPRFGLLQAERFLIAEIGPRMSSVSSFEHFLESVLKPRTTRVEDAGLYAEKACSYAGSSSWLRPCSKQRDETQLLETGNADDPENPFPVDELVDDAPVFVDVKAEMEEFDNAVEQRRLDRLASSQRGAPRRSL
ncbi:hypothetical protein AALP_AA7G145700 [Arabis alpina]|uniref:Uncharacterized protein n=1 Tax=Arabis alpina TaxID=50452 RepID=A0A087GI23_ARAAL|nr:hypothetical protein AALP_AA7G145700 [Arabis alpina]